MFPSPELPSVSGSIISSSSPTKKLYLNPVVIESDSEEDALRMLVKSEFDEFADGCLCTPCNKSIDLFLPSQNK